MIYIGIALWIMLFFAFMLTAYSTYGSYQILKQIYLLNDLETGVENATEVYTNNFEQKSYTVSKEDYEYLQQQKQIQRAIEFGKNFDDDIEYTDDNEKKI